MIIGLIGLAERQHHQSCRAPDTTLQHRRPNTERNRDAQR
jgi:hypothetical protein